MKMRERMREIASTPAYAEFCELWQRLERRALDQPGALRLLSLGGELADSAGKAAYAHALAQTGGRKIVTGPTGQVFMMEMARARDVAIEKEMPELHAFRASALAIFGGAE